jgi:hypothetical protein
MDPYDRRPNKRLLRLGWEARLPKNKPVVSGRESSRGSPVTEYMTNTEHMNVAIITILVSMIYDLCCWDCVLGKLL